MSPRHRRAVGHRLEQGFTADRIVDFFKFLRQVEIIPADEAVLDKALRLRRGSEVPSRLTTAGNEGQSQKVSTDRDFIVTEKPRKHLEK